MYRQFSRQFNTFSPGADKKIVDFCTKNSKNLEKHSGKPQNPTDLKSETVSIDVVIERDTYFGSGGYVFGSMVAHMEPAERICYDNAANDLPSASVMLNCGSILTP